MYVTISCLFLLSTCRVGGRPSQLQLRLDKRWLDEAVGYEFAQLQLDEAMSHDFADFAQRQLDEAMSYDFTQRQVDEAMSYDVHHELV